MNSLSLNSNVYFPNKTYSDQIKQVKKLICTEIKTVFTVVCFLLLLNQNVNYSLSPTVPCILLCLIIFNNIFTPNLLVLLVFFSFHFAEVVDAIPCAVVQVETEAGTPLAMKRVQQLLGARGSALGLATVPCVSAESWMSNSLPVS